MVLWYVDMLLVGHMLSSEATVCSEVAQGPDDVTRASTVHEHLLARCQRPDEGETGAA